MADFAKINPGHNFVIENYVGMLRATDTNLPMAGSAMEIFDPIRKFNNRFWNKKQNPKNKKHMPVVFNQTYGNKSFYREILKKKPIASSVLEGITKQHWKGTLPAELNSKIIKDTTISSEDRLLIEAMSTMGKFKYGFSNQAVWLVAGGAPYRSYNRELVEWRIKASDLNVLFADPTQLKFNDVMAQGLFDALGATPVAGTTYYKSKVFYDFDFQYQPYASGEVFAQQRNFSVNSWYYEYNACEEVVKTVDEAQIKFHYKSDGTNALFMPTSKFAAADAGNCTHKGLKNGLTIITSPAELRTDGKTIGAIQKLHSDANYTGYRPNMFNEITFDTHLGGFYGSDSSGFWPGFLKHDLLSKNDSTRHLLHYLTVAHKVAGLVPGLAAESVLVGEYGGAYIYGNHIYKNFNATAAIAKALKNKLGFYFDLNDNFIYFKDAYETLNKKIPALGWDTLEYKIAETYPDAGAFKQPWRSYQEIMDGKLARHEIVAYKIIKSKKDRTSQIQYSGDYGHNHNDVVEEIYIFPQEQKNDIISYVDTQIKYDEAYFYDLYAVMLVWGTKYRYTDIELNIPEFYSDSWTEAPDNATPYFWSASIAGYHNGAPHLEAIAAGYKDAWPNWPLDKADPNAKNFINWWEGLFVAGWQNFADYIKMARLPYYWSASTAGNNSAFGALHQLATSKGFNGTWPDWPLDSANATATAISPTAEEFINWWKDTSYKTRKSFADFIEKTMKEELYPSPFEGYQSDFSFKARMLLEPKILIQEVPLILSDNLEVGHVVNEPPLPPEVEIIPYHGISDKILFLFQPGVGDYIKLVTEDEKNINHWKNSKKVTENKQLQEYQMYFSGGEKILEYRLYRMDKKPKFYSEFPKEPYKIINLNEASLIDDLEPNKRYYYIATAKSAHNVESFPSPVYSIEIVDEGGVIFPLIEVIPEILTPIEEEEVRKCEENFLDFRKKLRILPALLQSAPNINKGQYPGLGFENEETLNEKSDKNSQDATGANPIKHHNIRPDFKFRVTSNKTQRKVDLNILFRKQTSWPLSGFLEDADLLLSWDASKKMEGSLMAKVATEKAAAASKEVGKKCKSNKDCLTGMCGVKKDDGSEDLTVDCGDPKINCECLGTLFGN